MYYENQLRSIISSDAYFILRLRPCRRPPGSCWLVALKFNDFRSPGTSFFSILGSWGTTLTSIWWLFGARFHSGGLLNVPWWIYIDFSWIVDAIWGSLLGHFFIFCVIWGIKKHVWIAGTIFDDFWLEKYLISDVPASQKHSKYNCFH